jgi:hypothetical protein
MNLTICPVLCNECPFSNTSVPGYLGPHSVDDILDLQQNEQIFACHKQLTGDDDFEKVMSGEINICRGYLLSATKSCKQFGSNIHVGKALEKLQNGLDDSLDVAELPLVLARHEFRKHHTE